MSWGLGWKRLSDIFHLTLVYGTDDDLIFKTSPESTATPPTSASSSSSSPSSPKEGDLGFRVELEWTVGGEDDDQVALRLQSQLMVELPLPQDKVDVELRSKDEGNVAVEMKVTKRREPLRVVAMVKVAGSGQQNDGTGVLIRLMNSEIETPVGLPNGDETGRFGEHWNSVTVLSLCGCGLAAFPVELTQLPNLEKLYLDYNKLSVLPAEVGEMKTLKVLAVDYNMLASVPVELRQCVSLLELSLEHNRLVRPLLDFRAMPELQILRLFGNPLEFLPDILPLERLRHLSLANIRIVADDNLKSVNVQIEVENSSYFVASRHKLSPFFSLIFRFSSSHHPLVASALAKVIQDEENRVFVSKDENALRQLISMISSDNRHVVEQASFALSSLAADISLAMQLMRSDIMKPIEIVLKTAAAHELINVLQVVVTLALASDTVAQKMFTKDMLKSLKSLCAHKDPEVQRLALLAVGNLAFCLENRQNLVASESIRELLLRLTIVAEPRVSKAAARALAILGENENLRRAIRGRYVSKKGLRILTMDGGGMKGLATVQILKEIERRTGKQIHEMFDLICGTSTGGMLACALGIKLMTLDQCEEIYKNLGKLVFAEPVPKDNEAVSWREKFDQLYKSSSQNFRVVVHGSKHSADQFERLLKEMCADEDGDLLVDSAVKNVPKVVVVSTLVSAVPAQPFIFRNYQYPAGTPEVPINVSESSGINISASTGVQVGYKRCAFIGSCKHKVWQAIRASSAAPYYLDDYSDGVNRWQDGAIVANNPTIFAVREAQLLWPDTKIDCLVSIGCGSVPTKVRRGGWRYLDTGQVLIESACSVDRVEDALSSLLPMLPEIHYFRFNPVDDRCNMELDETDPAEWLKLEGATDEYIQNNSEAFDNACERLLLHLQHDDNLQSQQFSKTKSSGENNPSLGWRRNILLVEALHSPDSARVVHHARQLESFCARNGIRLSFMNGKIGTIPKTPSSTGFSSSFASPLLSGNLPSTSFASPVLSASIPHGPQVCPPDLGPQKIGRIDMVPHLSLEAIQSAKPATSPPMSPVGLRQLALPVRSLHEKLHSMPRVGIVHLALQNDSSGSILSWQNDVFVVAEPSELADKFLQNIKYSTLSLMRGLGRKCDLSSYTKISTIADLVAHRPFFQVRGIVHRYVGRQTHVMEDDQEIGAYMFRRTVPSMYITPDDVRQMVGAWRDRIIVCSGTYGFMPALIKAFLDSGAKAVVCSSVEPPQMQLNTSQGPPEFNAIQKGKFEIGEEDADDDEVESISPISDWEDEPEKNTANHLMSFWDDSEEQLSQFICQLYDSLFQESASIDFALRKALAAHGKLRYSCHLPSTK